MALYFHKAPIMLCSKTLNELVALYKGYLSVVEYPTADEENYEKSRSRIALLLSALKQSEKAEKTFKNCTTRSETSIGIVRTNPRKKILWQRSNK